MLGVGLVLAGLEEWQERYDCEVDGCYVCLVRVGPALERLVEESVFELLGVLVVWLRFGAAYAGLGVVSGVVGGGELYGTDGVGKGNRRARKKILPLSQGGRGGPLSSPTFAPAVPGRLSSSHRRDRC